MRIESDNRRFFNSLGNSKHVQNLPTNLNNRNFSSDGVRRRTKPKTMDNYDLLLITYHLIISNVVTLQRF
jgi:hypothetical protein